MDYQKNMTKRMDLFEDTMKICEREQVLLHAVGHSTEHTMLWRNVSTANYDVPEGRYGQFCKVEVTDSRLPDIVKLAKENRPDCRIGMGCYISAWHPGGSVIRGGEGCEENLCRCSTLYPCLNNDYLREEYYVRNRSGNGESYMDSCIYIPDVIYFKDDVEAELNIMKQEEWFNLDVICCAWTEAAKRNRVWVMEEDLYGKDWSCLHVEIPESRLEQWLKNVLLVASMQKIDVLILEGLEGITYMEDIIKKVLREYEHSFQAVYFRKR